MSVSARVAQITAAGFVILAIAAARQPSPLSAHGAEPTYAEDVAPILYKNCAACHRDGQSRGTLASPARYSSCAGH